MINVVILSGHLVNGKYTKEFDNVSLNGKRYKTISTQMSVSQFVGGGRGYNGSDYQSVFYNLQYKVWEGTHKIQDGSKIIVVGSIRQTKGSDGKNHTVIVAEKIEIAQQMPVNQNGRVEYQNFVQEKMDEKSENYFNNMEVKDYDADAEAKLFED